MMRRIGVLLAVVAVGLLVGAAPAAAHGGATVTIHSDGRGSVWITAQWQDGHPINEPTPVTLTATPAGGTAAPVGPATLRQTGDERGTQTYGGTLGPGSWRVSIDLGAPVDGHCQALVPVAEAAASPAPVEVACLVPATATSAPAEPSGGGGSLTPLWITLGVLVVAGAGLVAYRRRARR
ncbi:hypothetical protein ACFFX1_24435 [Dactylosporangium sucinum]|uniref:Uncharacterized protein n=1 Tax=Dactylosporangium sucinum TaxID=1424081 RepID=A0A917TYC3_9ACTN|nr:hypothetical protein [Dactylosporangium sucinum]GGM44379.1 hypothetical protein GCM10007977_052450 [Dactylosporangium sucinum]